MPLSLSQSPLTQSNSQTLLASSLSEIIVMCSSISLPLFPFSPLSLVVGDCDHVLLH